MLNLIEHERQKYEDIWTIDSYVASASPGELCLPLFLDMAKPNGGTVLDAGCGKGKGGIALINAGFDVAFCDITDALDDRLRGNVPFFTTCLWEDLEPLAYMAKIREGQFDGEKFDYVYCCDVMEHIPPTFAMLTVSRLLEVARFGVFFTISFVPDVFGVWVGEHLHMTLQSFVDWRDQLNTIGRVVEARDLHSTGVYWVVPR